MTIYHTHAARLLRLLILCYLTPTLIADTAPLDKAPVIDISAQLQQQSADNTALSSGNSASARRLRAMTHHNIGVGSLNGQPMLVVEDINEEVIEHELHDYGHVHKTAHMHRNADGSQFLHVQTLEHDTLHHAQEQQQANALPHVPHDLSQKLQQHMPADVEKLRLQALQQQHSEQIINQVITDDNDIIVHGSHTHRRSDVNKHSTLIIATLLVTFAISQAGIYFWKQYHEKSYTTAAIGGCWLVPVLYTIYHHLHNHHFVAIWSIYTALTAYCIYATRINRKTPLSKYTPRIVYGFVYVVFHVCYGLTMIGLLTILADLFGLTYGVASWTGLNIFPLFTYTFYPLLYGCYFGCLSRDCAELLTSRLAVNIGYTSTKNSKAMPRQLPMNQCALCDGKLYDTIEETHTLPCSHTFHSFCLKGWTLIGKRDSCPFCLEKVDLNRFIDKPWMKPTLWYGTLLDVVRYLIVFNPLIFIIANWVLLLVY